MKNIFRIFAVVAVMMMLSTTSVWAGNDNRRGTAGASELLVNPWAHSAGWGCVNVANVRGLDAFYTNIAGLSFINKIEATYSNTMLFGGKSGLNSGASINSFGLAMRLSDRGVLGFSIMAMGFGDIDRTTEESPEPINGTFSPTMMNLNVAFAWTFTQSIHGGGNIKIITESTDDLTATGFAVDAGIQYVTGPSDNVRFGISLKNWGPSFGFSGTGNSFSFFNDAGNNMTAEFREGEMELPTSLSMGASYDFLFESLDQRLTFAAAFISNSFRKDNFNIGMEYSMLNILELRCGYVYETNVFSHSESTTAFKGLCAGASVNVPLHKKDSESNTGLTIDYAYRSADRLRGTHSIGATFRF
ncbi:MAG: PorV/PorQ family protein [Bacteroidales bacterium]|nr:PorV/PorQ family protein [Bacteroidales bacterium]